MKKLHILIAGRVDLGPLGRHVLSFVDILSRDPSNVIYLDRFWIHRFWIDEERTGQIAKGLLKIDNVKMAPNDTDFVYDFAVLTDLISLDYKCWEYKKFFKRKARIRSYYCVFDGSMPPLDWVDFINRQFDFCLSPSVYTASRLRKHGVQVPCFDLPCAVFNEELLKHEKKMSEKTFRFGFIGGSENRKNAIKTVEAFHKVFKGVEDVELAMHCAYSAEPKYTKKLKETVKKFQKEDQEDNKEKKTKKDNEKEKSNITLAQGKMISNEDMIEFISSFDCYVYPSKTTGYFTTPAEALSLGVPVIISNIGVHHQLAQGLTEDDGMFLVPAKIAEPICHSYIGNRFLGAQYDCDEDDISALMLKAYEKRHTLFTLEKINRRKEHGRAYSPENLIELYAAVFRPIEIRSSKVAAAWNGVFYFDSPSLRQKYKAMHPDLLFSFIRDEQPEKYLGEEDDHITEVIEELCLEIEKTKYKLAKRPFQNIRWLISKLARPVASYRRMKEIGMLRTYRRFRYNVFGPW